eukprot:scaffold249075_cov21-Tisochrysis_lutea.AAC.1
MNLEETEKPIAVGLAHRQTSCDIGNYSVFSRLLTSWNWPHAGGREHPEHPLFSLSSSSFICLGRGIICPPPLLFSASLLLSSLPAVPTDERVREEEAERKIEM